jgi:cobalt-zinc-cadmium efflux system protein
MLVILVSTWSLVKDSFKMAVDAVPAGIDLHSIIAIMKKVPYVTDVRHVHIWPLSTTENALTAQIAVDDALPFPEKIKVVHHLKHELEHHNIHHSTIELMATE